MTDIYFAMENRSLKEFLREADLGALSKKHRKELNKEIYAKGKTHPQHIKDHVPTSHGDSDD